MTAPRAHRRALPSSRSSRTASAWSSRRATNCHDSRTRPSERKLTRRTFHQVSTRRVHSWQPRVMVAGMLPEAGPMPRRARQLIPAGVPRRGELIAAGAVVIVLAHLLLAQLTIVLALTFTVVGKVTRWRLYW